MKDFSAAISWSKWEAANGAGRRGRAVWAKRPAWLSWMQARAPRCRIVAAKRVSPGTKRSSSMRSERRDVHPSSETATLATTTRPAPEDANRQ